MILDAMLKEKKKSFNLSCGWVEIVIPATEEIYEFLA